MSSLRDEAWSVCTITQKPLLHNRLLCLLLLVSNPPIKSWAAPHSSCRCPCCRAQRCLHPSGNLLPLSAAFKRRKQGLRDDRHIIDTFQNDCDRSATTSAVCLIVQAMWSLSTQVDAKKVAVLLAHWSLSRLPDTSPSSAVPPPHGAPSCAGRCTTILDQELVPEPL